MRINMILLATGCVAAPVNGYNRDPSRLSVSLLPHNNVCFAMQEATEEVIDTTSTSGKTGEDVLFTFVHPNKVLTTQARRAIRSHAAKTSAGTRKATIAAKLQEFDNADSREREIIRSQPPAKTYPLRRKGRPSNANLSQGLPTLLHESPTPSYSEGVDSVFGQASSSSTARASIFGPLGQGRMDPFRTFATCGIWHESFPRLIDICKCILDRLSSRKHPDVPLDLCSIALPSLSVEDKNLGQGYQRELLRRHLWPEMQSNSSLFYANLLVAAFHDSLPTNLALVAWFRHLAIRSINEDLENKTRPSNANIAAVSILAGFEREFGDRSTFDTHMKGLQMMLSMRGGLEAGDLPQVIQNLALSVGVDLPAYAGLRPYFRSAKLIGKEDIIDRSPGLLPGSFQKLRDMCVMQPTMLVLVSAVSNFNPAVADARQTLRSLGTHLATWQATKYLAVDFCPVQSPLEDEINSWAHYILRVALLCLVDRYWSIATGDDAVVEVPGFSDHWLQSETRTLRPEALVGTVFAELTLWSLFIICGKFPQIEPRFPMALKHIANDLHLYSLPEVLAFLTEYFPLEDHLRKQGELVWHHSQMQRVGVMQGNIGGTSRYHTMVFASRSDRAEPA